MDDEILLIDKPEGISSFGVVARVRRKLSENIPMVEIRGKDGAIRQKRKKVKVGHTGTLDPFATGLLILLVGKGTKRANEFLKLDKEYVATMKLGEVSTTGDKEGVITSFIDDQTTALLRDRLPRPVVTGEAALKRSPLVATCPEIKDCPVVKEIITPSMARVEEVVRGFVGEIEQTVPAFSAVKINGQRAYKLARAGKKIEMPRRKVKIYEIEILGYKWPELTIRCRVSSGTYIRALGEDIGRALGTGAYLTALRRTQVGEYRIEDARKMDAACSLGEKVKCF